MAGPAEVEWRRLHPDQLREKARHDPMVILPAASLDLSRHG